MIEKLPEETVWVSNNELYYKDFNGDVWWIKKIPYKEIPVVVANFGEILNTKPQCEHKWVKLCYPLKNFKEVWRCSICGQEKEG